MPRKTKYNNITSPELLSKVNPDNMRLKNDFLCYLQSIQRSPKTIAGYSNDLDIMLTWNHLYNRDKEFIKITKRDWAAFQNWLINVNGNSPARVRRLKASISSLSNYISNILDDEDEFRDFRPVIRKIENPAMQQVRQKTVWEDEQLDKLQRANTRRRAQLHWQCAVGAERQNSAVFGSMISKTRISYATVRCTKRVNRFRRRGSVLENIFIATLSQRNSSRILTHGWPSAKRAVLKANGCSPLRITPTNR